MNLLDIALLGITAFSIGAGIMKGLVREIFNIVGVLAAILVAIVLAPVLAPRLDAVLPYESSGYAESLILIFVATLILASLLAHLVHKLVEAAQLGAANRLLGGVFGLVRGALISLFLVLGLALFLPARSTVLTGSTLTPYLAVAAKTLAPLLPDQPREVLQHRLDALPPPGGHPDGEKKAPAI